jgi:hypothetical protein
MPLLFKGRGCYYGKTMATSNSIFVANGVAKLSILPEEKTAGVKI